MTETMLVFTLITAACLACVHAHDEAQVIEVSNNKSECVNQMVQWCNGMQYPQEGIGLAVLSLTYKDPKGYYRVFCTSDLDGTNCTRNAEPWFTCSPAHVLSYKGQVLTNSTPPEDVDGDICKTADKAFNELFVQNLSYENTTLKNEVEKGMEAFFEQMALMEEQIELIQKLLKRLPGIEDIWREYDDGFLFQDSDLTTINPGDNQKNSDLTTADNRNNNTEQVNRIEK